jgi:hypothetical protein
MAHDNSGTAGSPLDQRGTAFSLARRMGRLALDSWGSLFRFKSFLDTYSGVDLIRAEYAAHFDSDWRRLPSSAAGGPGHPATASAQR